VETVWIVCGVPTEGVYSRDMGRGNSRESGGGAGGGWTVALVEDEGRPRGEWQALVAAILLGVRGGKVQDRREVRHALGPLQPRGASARWFAGTLVRWDGSGMRAGDGAAV